MNRTKLKTYAPQARREFIQAITDRAAFYGLTANNIEAVTAEQGDIAIIGGKPFPRSILEKRHKLIERINRNGFTPTMEAIAYTWFNRFVAIRFMELHGYLDHGYRVLSHPEAKETPEILLYAEHIALPGLNLAQVIELKLDGTKEAELYRLLLVAQCNALSAAMPFLFERVDDETELLLPDNLLHSDSLIRKLVNDIDENDWQQVEIIGWLYQFYISEKKDEVIGKVVKSEDIPAATQLFTPNWIVKYLVQNSIGRMWLEANPTSNLASKMEYFIKPDSSTKEHEAARSMLNPEDITVLDPACGSGHILVEAYDLLKEIYLERGYRLRDIPRLILGKNLFGLDIDDRAAQLASFVLLMKARADDRRLFDRYSTQSGSDGVQPDDNPIATAPGTVPLLHILTIPDSSALASRPHQLAESLFSAEARRGAIPIRDAKYLFGEMEAQPSLLMVEEARIPQSAIPNPQSAITEQHIIDLLERFEMGKTLGSLIRLPSGSGTTLAAIAELLADKRAHGDIYEKTAARQMEPFVRAAELLHAKYDCVIANPPYMGGGYFIPNLKEYVMRHYAEGKDDLYGCFMLRNAEFCKPNGLFAMITIPNWMFLTSFEKLRNKLFDGHTIDSLIHNGRGVFGSDFGSCSFVIKNACRNRHKGVFKRLFEKAGSVASNEELERRFLETKIHEASTDDFKKIPGSPIAYWVSDKVREIFVNGKPLSDVAETRLGMATGDNERYVRLWGEVSQAKVGLAMDSRETANASKKKWFPYNKGGDYRRWYGNNDYLVNWENDGFLLQNTRHPSGRIWAHNFNLDYIFKPSITWSSVSSSFFGVRLSSKGFLFGTGGSSAFPETELMNLVIGFLSSVLAGSFTKIISPTLNFEVGDIGKLPFLEERLLAKQVKIDSLVRQMTETSRADWDSFETSWDFQTFPLLRSDLKAATVEQSFLNWQHACQANIQRMQELETENNRLFIDAYGLADELSPDVPEAQITLARADRSEDTKRLLSYSLGCVMGRYSLDRAGLMYADSGNVGFDAAQYPTFPADADGIVPLMEIDWFDDDATNRLEEFVRKVWCSTGSGSDLVDAPDPVATALGTVPAWSERYGTASGSDLVDAPDQVATAPRTVPMLEANLRWIAQSLGTSRDEDARTTIRRYFATGFFKDHLKTYKKRPIYWLFSSGKQRAFQCLVYLHRYHEGTLARMRTEYVIPLQGKIATRIEQLEHDQAAATSTAHRKKLDKEQDTLKKHQTELVTFDEKLRHYADMRIALDLDDGVKVNYGKFGDLLAEVKAVTGGSEE